MRKYRNGKQSRDSRRDTKYSEEYLIYRNARGSKSIKGSLCDTDNDGFSDSIVRAWRSPSAGKTEICGIVFPAPQSPPTGISTLASPQSAPSGISAEIPVLPGPSGISVLASPQVGPTNISVTVSPQVGPTSISVTTPPQVGPTNISTYQSNFITFEGQTYDLVESSSTINVSGQTATRQDDSDETLIPISASSTWSGSTDGPIITVMDSSPNAHHCKIDTTEGTTSIIDRQSGIFSNGQATGDFNKLYVHDSNLISGSTTRSKAILRITWRSISNVDIKTEYFKIGFEQN